MEKLSITLPEQMVDHVHDQVASGRYASTSEYIREALRERIERDAELTLMKARFQRAKSQAQNGETLSADEVFRRVEEKIAAISEED